MQLSIVIPAYNEERRIGPMLEEYLPYFVDRYGKEVELIVVINGTRDRTEEVVRAKAERYPQLQVVVEKAAIGKGGAIMRGLGLARGDLVGFVDADGATPPQSFQDLVDRIGMAGVIIASRWIKGAEVSPKQPLSRRVASRIFNWMVRNIFGVKIHDTQCGAKLMRREVVTTVLPRLEEMARWAFDVDLLFEAHREGYAIIETPTVWHDRDGSRLRVVAASIQMLKYILRLRMLYSPLRQLFFKEKKKCCH